MEKLITAWSLQEQDFGSGDFHFGLFAMTVPLISTLRLKTLNPGWKKQILQRIQQNRLNGSKAVKLAQRQSSTNTYLC